MIEWSFYIQRTADSVSIGWISFKWINKTRLSCKASKQKTFLNDKWNTSECNTTDKKTGLGHRVRYFLIMYEYMLGVSYDFAVISFDKYVFLICLRRWYGVNELLFMCLGTKEFQGEKKTDGEIMKCFFISNSWGNYSKTEIIKQKVF